MEERFELVALPNGLKTLRVAATKQVFHPVIGPVAEAERIHVAGTRLVARTRAAAEKGEAFVVWDVGLGAGANALTAIRALEGADGLGGAEVRLESFDRTLAPLEFALAHAGELGYPRGREGWLEELRSRHQVRVRPAGAGVVEWTLHLGDFSARLLAGDAPLPAPHAIFFDPYSPAANPEMWSLELFASLHRRLDPGAGCLMTTYTRSTAVRATLLLAGWCVGVGGATGEKDETTVAANDPALLERPLDHRWLERAYVSTNGAPLRASAAEGYTRGPISEEDFARLRAHGQFR